MITTDGYREKSSDTIIFMCIIEKVTAIGRVTAIGYWPAIECNIYITHAVCQVSSVTLVFLSFVAFVIAHVLSHTYQIHSNFFCWNRELNKVYFVIVRYSLSSKIPRLWNCEKFWRQKKIKQQEEKEHPYNYQVYCMKVEKDRSLNNWHWDTIPIIPRNCSFVLPLMRKGQNLTLANMRSACSVFLGIKR